MKLLVLGVDGQVGSELTRSLRLLGEVIALNRNGCDLARSHTIPAVLQDAKADVVINAAAYTAVDQAETDEPLVMCVNCTAVGVIAQELRKTGALFVQYSTDYVFDGAKFEPYLEIDSPSPLNAYGRSKLSGEVAIREAGGDHLILRTSWVFAARGRNFLTTILHLARERDELRIVADQIGAPTWARDIADATAHVIRQAQRERKQGDFTPNLVHMTAAGATSWHGFAQAILGQAGDLVPARPALLPITSEEYVTPARRPKNSRLCCDRLRERFGVVLPEWEAGLAQCFDHSKKSHHALA